LNQPVTFRGRLEFSWSDGEEAPGRLEAGGDRFSDGRGDIPMDRRTDNHNESSSSVYWCTLFKNKFIVRRLALTKIAPGPFILSNFTTSDLPLSVLVELLFCSFEALATSEN